MAAEGLFTPEVKDHSEEKYRIVTNYAHMFTSSMSRQWHCVYVDLFAGAGRVHIGGRVVDATPLRVLRLKKPFERYIFCDIDQEQLHALRSRVEAEFGNTRDVRYVAGDANERVGDVLRHVPPASAAYRVLTLCFADPYNVKDLKFVTLQTLSKLYVDFLVLIASDMDAHRNVKQFVRASSKVVEEFTGDPEWRQAWALAQSANTRFGDFVSDHFIHQMSQQLGYLLQALPDTHRMRSTEKNLPLYRLALLSRNKLAAKFFKESKKYSTDQKPLF